MLDDEILIRKVEEPNPSYIFREEGAILNWNDITEVDGFLSLNSNFGDLWETEEGTRLGVEILTRVPKRPGKPGVKESEEEAKKGVAGFSVMRLIRLSKAKMTREELLAYNEQLNRIPKAR